MPDLKSSELIRRRRPFPCRRNGIEYEEFSFRRTNANNFPFENYKAGEGVAYIFLASSKFNEINTFSSRENTRSRRLKLLSITNRERERVSRAEIEFDGKLRANSISGLSTDAR